jgi:2-methylcitrate dehydratase PrpD
LAYSQAAGNFQAFVDGTLAFPLQQGFSSRVGVLSARLAESGLTGAKNFFEGRCGFYPVYYRGIDYDMQRLLEGFGERYEVLNLASKPYPSTGFTNGPIQNVLEIMRENHLSSEDIDTVVMRVGQRMFNNTCRPKEVKYRPKTVTDAIFSLPYVVGTALYKEDVFLEDFSPEAIREAGRLAEVDKVQVVSDPDIEEEVKRLNLPLSLHLAEIKAKKGRSFSQKMLYPKGFPQNPMTLDESAEKTKRCAGFAAKEFSGEKVNRLVELIADLERLEDVRLITEILI